MEYKDKFVVCITSLRSLNNCFSSQGIVRTEFSDFETAKKYAEDMSYDIHCGKIPLDLKTTIKTTGIKIYGEPIVYSLKSPYSHRVVLGSTRKKFLFALRI